jgi:hypothetical protein
MIEYIKGFDFELLRYIPEPHELEDLIIEGKWDLRVPDKNLVAVHIPLYQQANMYRLKDFVKKFKPDLYQKYRLLIE